jgi:hypothetical protein
MGRRGMVYAVLLAILALSVGAPRSWAADPALQADQARVQKFAGIRAMNSAKGVTSLTSAVYSDFDGLVTKDRVPAAAAARKQRDALAAHPDVAEARELKGSNIFVRFKDNNELIMLMGRDRFGGEGDEPMLLALSPAGISQPQPISPLLQNKIVPNIPSTPPKLMMFALPWYSCTSNRALIFDPLDDDIFFSPVTWTVVQKGLQAMGYSVDVVLNDQANLAMESKIDDGRYGVVFMRGHGCVTGGNDFAYMARPWYTSYPPPNAQYAGTIRMSVNTRWGLRYCYAITGSFANSYWQNARFPGTTFFLLSCHGTDPLALPGMPTWALNHGAEAWLGWNDSVTVACGDPGTQKFFTLAAAGNTFGQAVSTIYAGGCRPPDLTLNTDGTILSLSRLAFWYPDPDEPVSNDRDFKALTAWTEDRLLYITVLFQAAPTLGEFNLFMDANGDGAAEFLVKCSGDSYSLRRQSSPGVYDQSMMMSAPARDGESYMICIPWDTLGSGTAGVYLTSDVGGDRLPDGGKITIKK